MTDKHTEESRFQKWTGIAFGLIAVVIAIGIVIGIVVGKDRFFPPEGAPGSTAAILVFAGLAFFFSAGLAVWCLPPSKEATEEAEEAKKKAGEAKKESGEAEGGS